MYNMHIQCTSTSTNTYISLLFLAAVKSLQVTKHLNFLYEHLILE